MSTALAAAVAVVVILLVVGILHVVDEVRAARARRRRVEQERVLAEYRVRQVAQAGLRQMLDEARRRSS